MHKPIIIHLDINQTIIAHDKVNNKRRLDGSLNNASDMIIHPESGLTYNEHAKKLYPGTSNENKRKRQQLFLDGMMEHATPQVKEMMERATSMPDDVVLALAFLGLIQWLKDNQYLFLIHLRTFGTDLDDVVPLVEQAAGIKFHQVQANKVSTEKLAHLLHTRHCAVKDDYRAWIKNGKDWKYGKKFPICNRAVNIFFDDNVSNNIVCPLQVNVSKVTLLYPKEMVGKLLINASILEAFSDSLYFVKAIHALLPE